MVFNNITRTQFDSIASKVSDETGIKIDADTGTKSGSGFTVHWSYTEASGTLTVDVLKKPTLVPMTMIETKIFRLISEAQESS